MKQTKKAKAFELFSQGYLPLSQEIKALGLHKSNRYKYFTEWEKLGKPEVLIGASKGKSAPISSSTSSGETIGNIDETKAKPKNGQEEKPKPTETLSQWTKSKP